MIDDDPDMDPEVFFELRRRGGRRGGNNAITAVAVRERGTNKFARVLRFMYTVPPEM